MTDKWDICSTAGLQARNDDYGLYDSAVGACLADGISRYPMGDAIARYACHVALDSMREGRDARASLEQAQALVADFAKAVDSPRSGAAVTVLKKVGPRIEIAWLGDVLCFLHRDENRYLEPLNAPHRIGSKLKAFVGGNPANPSYTTVFTHPGDRILLCTDGVWDEMPWADMQRILSESTSQQEACARLVLGRQTRDNATALALFID